MSTEPTALQLEDTQPDTTLPTPTATPQKRKQSNSSNAPQQEKLKMARLNSETPAEALLDSSARQYGIYMHDLLQDPETTTPQLVAQGTNWSSAYEAMRTHAADLVSANPGWGATREETTHNLYEVLDYKKHVKLRYEVDAIYPAGKDESGADIWKRVGELAVLRVHYGMYVDLYCDKDRAQNFFVSGFESLGEATFSMKQSAGAAITGQHNGKGAKLFETRLDLVDGKGKALQRYNVKKGSLNEHGAFVRDEEWDMDWQAGRDGVQSVVDRKPSVLNMDTHMAANPPPLPQTAQQIEPFETPAKPQAKPARNTRRKPEQPAPEAAPSVEAAAEAPPPAKSTRRQSKLAAPSTADAEEDEDEDEDEPAPGDKPKPKAKSGAKKQEKQEIWCTCRLPDDGSFMIGCENDDCPIQWYHGRCVNIHQALPDGTDWYCALCMTGRENMKGKGKAKTPAKTPKKGGGAKTKGKGKAKGKK
jgi:hypothetical protein